MIMVGESELAELRKAAACPWVPASERLPAIGVPVVVVAVGGGVYAATWTGAYWRSPSWPGFAAREFVAHWCPLPE